MLILGIVNLVASLVCLVLLIVLLWPSEEEKQEPTQIVTPPSTFVDRKCKCGRPYSFRHSFPDPGECRMCRARKV